MKVVAYLRVSTDKQAEKGLGLDVQEQAVRKWARAEGHRLVAVLRDEGVSGSNGIDTREALPEALALLRDGGAAGLVVYRLDRLARDLIIQETLLAEVRRLGAEVFSTSRAEADFLQDDPNDPSRKMIRQILGAVAEYERSMIALRLKSGRRRKAEQGGYAYGAPPLGYRAENRELTEDPEELEAVRAVEALHRDGLSLREIANELTGRGLMPKRGTVWHPNTVRRIIDRQQ